LLCQAGLPPLCSVYLAPLFWHSLAYEACHRHRNRPPSFFPRRGRHRDLPHTLSPPLPFHLTPTHTPPHTHSLSLSPSHTHTHKHHTAAPTHTHTHTHT